jgi:hypothetical protein
VQGRAVIFSDEHAKARESGNRVFAVRLFCSETSTSVDEQASGREIFADASKICGAASSCLRKIENGIGFVAKSFDIDPDSDTVSEDHDSSIGGGASLRILALPVRLPACLERRAIAAMTGDARFQRTQPPEGDLEELHPW